MKNQFQNPYLLGQERAPQSNNGFTLIELLVVIITIGVLAAIAIPSFVKQVNRARAAEGTSNVAAINRAQSVQYQRQLKFAANLNELDTKINSRYYSYTISNPGSTFAGVETTTQWDAVRAISGAIATDSGDMKWLVCISDTEVNLGDPSTVPTNVPMSMLTCPPAYTELAK